VKAYSNNYQSINPAATRLRSSAEGRRSNVKVGKNVRKRHRCQFRVQPFVVEQHVLPQFRIHSALDQVERQFGELANVVANLATAVHRRRAKSQRLLAYLHCINISSSD